MKGVLKGNVIEKENEMQEKNKVGTNLDSWHLHVVCFLF